MTLKYDHAAIMAALKSGPKNVLDLAGILFGEPAKLSSIPHDLLEMVQNRAIAWEAMKDDGNIEALPFTLFPARERGRYGFPDIVPVVKGDKPGGKKRKVRNPNAKVQNQFWPVIALGDITPTATSEVETTYDGRYDDLVATLETLLTDADFNHLGIKGRMVRGGGGIYISLESGTDSVLDDDSVDADTAA